MSYQVLARKWRPRSFREMVGQTHVLKALINALDSQRLHHAYLFTGTRGVGKTTIARIIAKCLNCETGVSSTPCGVCSICKEIDEGRFIDLIEVEYMLIWTAAFNLANGHSLTPDDLERLAIAARLLQGAIDEVRA